jgi:hypothetical protein
MVARLRDICIDANDPQLVGAFWGAVLGGSRRTTGRATGRRTTSTWPPARTAPPDLRQRGAEPKTGKAGCTST